MKAILGRKIGMSQVFSPEGEAVPVTLINAPRNSVMVQRTEKRDGYEAVQLGLPRKAKQELPADDAKPAALQRHYAAKREFSGMKPTEKLIGVEQFAPGDTVTVIGTSKGKGFQGGVKRHNFKGGPASHGHRHVLRQIGSTGSRFPQHSLKGLRMPGRMGFDRVTVKNLTIMAVDTEQQLLAIRGAVPGPRGSIVEVIAADEAV